MKFLLAFVVLLFCGLCNEGMAEFGAPAVCGPVATMPPCAPPVSAYVPAIPAPPIGACAPVAATCTTATETATVRIHPLERIGALLERTCRVHAERVALRREDRARLHTATVNVTAVPACGPVLTAPFCH